jgi:hypothetical protein
VNNSTKQNCQTISTVIEESFPKILTRKAPLLERQQENCDSLDRKRRPCLGGGEERFIADDILHVTSCLRTHAKNVSFTLISLLKYCEIYRSTLSSPKKNYTIQVTYDTIMNPQ